jgi:ABC-type phosphate transport system substrate-binding protein
MRHLHRSVLRLCCVLLLAATAAAHADVYVIVHRDNPVASLGADKVASLYLGRSRSFGSGQFVVPVDQSGHSPVREQFFHELAGMTPPQVNAYWARLAFTGRVTPPQVRDDDAAVIEAVASDPLAIGYVSDAPADPRVRVVLRLGE